MKIANSIFIEKSEINSQKLIMSEIAKNEFKPSKYHIVTYGCQMNVNDSQKLSYMLDSMNIIQSENKNEADIIIFNTCCIRENAERRALGNIMWLKELKKKNPQLIIIVCGCMIQQADMANIILKQYKFVDIAFGTHNIHLFPELLLNRLKNNEQIIAINDEHVISEGLESKRDVLHHAYLSIMFGCNNYCTYCIVPYVRGRERSRRFDDIVNEADYLIKNGVKEIMLLGQNVNSYGLENNEKENFPKLLKKLSEIGVPRIRFMTSHPKDLSDELIEVMAESENIAKHIHLPVQAGNNSILKSMNRSYTREKYLDTIKKLRSYIPNIGISTDIIVGFPGETDAYFKDTLDLVNEVQFDSAFTFIYSKRKGTIAEKMTETVPKHVALERLQILNDNINTYAIKLMSDQINKNELLLVDEIYSRDSSNVLGRTSRNNKVIIKGNKDDIGKFINIHIEKIENNILKASRI